MEKKIQNTQTFKIFGGISQTCVHCLNCHYKSITKERYYDLNIVNIILNSVMPKIEYSLIRFQ